jgi:hypothetical protein
MTANSSRSLDTEQSDDRLKSSCLEYVRSQEAEAFNKCSDQDDREQCEKPMVTRPALVGASVLEKVFEREYVFEFP